MYSNGIDEKSINDYNVQISIHKSDGSLVVPVQRTHGPVLHTTTSFEQLLWLDTYNLEVPIDLLPDGAFAIISFNNKTTTLSWGKISLDKKTIPNGIMHVLMSEILPIDVKNYNCLDKSKENSQFFVVDCAIMKR